jgi:hypothetical protein
LRLKRQSESSLRSRRKRGESESTSIITITAARGLRIATATLTKTRSDIGTTDPKTVILPTMATEINGRDVRATRGRRSSQAIDTDTVPENANMSETASVAKET